MAVEDAEGYAYTTAYLMGAITLVLADQTCPTGPKRVFDLGCGNGANAAALA
jgi:methylase of polypeptide subunit release factors